MSAAPSKGAPVRREDLTDQEWQAFSNLCSIMSRLKAKVKSL